MGHKEVNSLVHYLEESANRKGKRYMLLRAGSQALLDMRVRSWRSACDSFDDLEYCEQFVLLCAATSLRFRPFFSLCWASLDSADVIVSGAAAMAVAATGSWRQLAGRLNEARNRAAIRDRAELSQRYVVEASILGKWILFNCSRTCAYSAAVMLARQMLREGASNSELLIGIDGLSNLSPSALKSKARGAAIVRCLHVMARHASDEVRRESRRAARLLGIGLGN
jgi:hypothetical protein